VRPFTAPAPSWCGKRIGFGGIRFRAALMAVALAFTGILAVPAPARAQANVQVTVTVIRLIQDEPPDLFGGDGELYAGVCWPDMNNNIGCSVRQPNAFLPNHVKTPVFKDDSPDVTPYWTLTRTFDRDTQSTANFALLMWDLDPAANGPDDVMDINPANDDVTLSFAVDLFTGTWAETTSDIPANIGFAKGDGDTESNPGWHGPGGEAGRVLFDISLSDDGDGDDDGIPDGIEITGVRDKDGTLVANFAALKANPCRKTIAVEMDFMETLSTGHSHRPKPAAVNEVLAAFENAGEVPARQNCPYPPQAHPAKPGVNLILDVDDPVTEAATLGTTKETACSTGLPATRDTSGSGLFNPAQGNYFHYVLWAHNLAPGVTNGGVQCRATTGRARDAIVSLGSFSTTCVMAGPNGTLETSPAGDDVVSGNRITNGPDRTCNSKALIPGDDFQRTDVGAGPDDDSVGTVREQSATLMHELGHALGLGHGGVEATSQTGNAVINFKPNYLSVMNYLFATVGLTDAVTLSTRIDYSSPGDPLALVKGILDENVGIGVRKDITAWFDPSGTPRADRDGAIDWNFSTMGAGPFEPSVRVDVNGNSRCINAGGTLLTTPVPDDAPNAAGNAIVNGSDDLCQTTTAVSPDEVALVPDSPCVATGADDVLTTVPVRFPFLDLDDVSVSRRWIGIGNNLRCDTLAAPGDLQITPFFASEPMVALLSSDDWAGLDFSDGLGGVGRPLPSAGALPPDITAEQAEEMEAFWRDARTTPGVTAAGQAPPTGPIVATFTETVEAVSGNNVTLRGPGAAALPVTTTCKNAAGGTVSCTARQVISVEVRPNANLVPGEHYELSINPSGALPITDLAGNAVPPTSLPFRGSLNENENSAAATYRWQPVKNAQAADSSYTRDHLKGAEAFFGFNGTSVTWLTVTGPNEGLASVIIDDKPVATVSLYAQTTTLQVPHTFGGLPSGDHTIKIQVLGTKGHPAATETFVSIDGFIVSGPAGETTYRTPELTYRWQPNIAFEDPPGVTDYYVRSDLKSAEVTFSFRGTGINFFYVQGPNQGRFSAAIDGKPAGVVDTYSPQSKAAVPIQFSGLSDGFHTLTVTVAGQANPAATGRYVSVDGWSVQ
jgi:hypothetical protein